MRIFTRYTIKSITVTATVAFLIFSFLVMAVETFMNMDRFIQNNLGLREMALYAFFSLSDYFLLLLSVSLLFSVSYFLSNLSANNELIALYTAGYSKRRIILPIFFFAIFITLLMLLFNENLGLRWKNGRDVVSTELFGRSGTQDATNVSLSDMESGFVVHADRYNQDNQRLSYPRLILVEGGKPVYRLEAASASYSGGTWTFENAVIHRMNSDGSYSVSTYSSYVEPSFTVESDMFLSQNMQMDTMDFFQAIDYLSSLRSLDGENYQVKVTEFLSRLFEPFTILVLMMIGMSMNYTFKKNVLLFSIVESLVIAVVYYVADMVFSITSEQGLTAPLFSVLAPMAMTILLSYMLSLMGKRI